MTLFTAAGNTGKVLTIQHGGTSLTQVYTLNTTGGQTIGGIASGSYALYTNGESLRIVSDGANWQILNHRTDTQWTTYTPTFTGFGTVTVQQGLWRRQGPDLLLQSRWTVGTTTGTEARVSLPSSITVASVMATRSLVGSGGSGASAGAVTLLYPMGVTGQAYITFGPNSNASNTSNTGSGLGASGDILQISVRIPITGWQP